MPADDAFGFTGQSLWMMDTAAFPLQTDVALESIENESKTAGRFESFFVKRW